MKFKTTILVTTALAVVLSALLACRREPEMVWEHDVARAQAKEQGLFEMAVWNTNGPPEGSRVPAMLNSIATNTIEIGWEVETGKSHIRLTPEAR